MRTISTSYTQLIKTLGTGGLDGSLQVITDGDDTQSALSLSTSAVSSTGSFSVVGASTLTGAVTCSNTLGVTGAATLSSSLGVTGAVTLSSTLNVTGAVTLSSSFTASTGTSTIGTLSCGTASIGTSTIGTINGTTGSFSGLTVAGSFKVDGGSTLTSMTYATAAYTGSTISDINNATNGNNISTGTFAFTGIGNSDIVLGSLSSLAGATGGTPGGLVMTFRTEATNVARYTILNCSSNTASTISAGTIHATALRFTA